ncbi:hypothetical protein Syun_021319 [Stephania yunnanensis]|uniref:Uncharacterized protein n=1 Tax=Stephania yunnanensis TaxID=152371 RepID=A0AAP0IFS8_9MAGN
MKGITINPIRQYKKHNLNVQDVRGQGYDGATDMREEWNRLQASISNECSYAYYVHCMTYCLQLAMVVASKRVIPVHQFFDKLNIIVNIVGALSKWNNQLKTTHATNIDFLLETNESGK